MATRYVRSTDGSNADDGSTWALAKASLTGIAAIDAAGDRIWVSQAHAETTAAAITLDFAGTVAAPTQLLCGNDAAEPPTAMATSAVVATTGANNIQINGNIYAYGITWQAGDAGNQARITLGAGSGAQVQKYEVCDFILNNSHVNSSLSGPQAGLTEFIDCRFKFGSASQKIGVLGTVHIRGGSLIAGGTSPSSLIVAFNTGAINTTIDGMDLTNLATTSSLIGSSGAGSGKVIFRNCKLPAGWAGSIFNAAPTGLIRGEIWNCDNTSTNYRMWVEDTYGSVKHETTLVKTVGASDGTTPLAWKMASSANASYPLPLCSPEIASAWIDSTGSAKTITVDILHDSATNLKDDEVWVEVAYLSDSASPKSSRVMDAKADILATAADQTTSSATWTTTGMGSPNKQKLAVSFTPQMKGVALVKVCLAKASYTVYVDPVAQVS